MLDYSPASLKVGFGGAKEYVRKLVSDLLRDGFRVSYCVNLHPFLERFCEELAQLGAKTERVDFDGPSPGLASQQLDQLLRATQPSIVHVNGSANLRAALFRSRGLRHGPWKRILTMHAPLASATFPDKRRWKDRIPLSWVWRTRRGDLKFTSLFDRIISVSRVHADALQRELHLPADLLVTIPNGVDIDRFRPQGSRQENGAAIVGGAGQLVPVKRFDILIDAVAAVSREVPVRLRIAGSGPEEPALRQRAAEQGVAEIVELAGDQRDMPGFLRSLDMFAMTSDSEGLPYAQLEAMATGLPSVVTAVGDLPLVVRDGVDGFVVPRQRTQRVAESLAQLIKHSDRRRTMGENARQRACETYSHERARRATIEVFRALLPTENG